MKNVRAIIQQYAGLQAEVEALEEQIAVLTTQKKRLQMQMEEIEEDIKADMIGANMKRANIAGWKINISQSTRTVIEAEDLLPDQYWRIERRPDLMKVKETLKLGFGVEGATLVVVQNINMKKADSKNLLIG